MKKISKITLENFRAFSGKREINFNNPDDKPVDFVLHIWEKWIWKNFFI